MTSSKKGSAEQPPRSLYSSIPATLCSCCWKDISNCRLFSSVLIISKYFIFLNFSSRWDNVTIVESSPNNIKAGPYCGKENPPNYKTTNNFASICLQSNYVVARTGFEIEYRCNPKTNCKDKKKEKKCKKLKKKGKCKKKNVWKKCKKTCEKC